MSDPVTLALISAIFALLTTVATTIGAVYLRLVDKKQGAAAKATEETAAKVEDVKHTLEAVAATSAHSMTTTSEKVEEVKATLAISTATRDEKLDAIHNLVNGTNDAHLQTIARLTRRIAKLTRKAEDMAAADLAEKLAEKQTAKHAGAK